MHQAVNVLQSISQRWLTAPHTGKAAKDVPNLMATTTTTRKAGGIYIYIYEVLSGRWIANTINLQGHLYGLPSTSLFRVPRLSSQNNVVPCACPGNATADMAALHS